MRRAMGMLAVAGVAFAMLASFGRADDEDVYKDWTTKVVLHPAAEPRPALKYQLLPPLRDRRPGNAVLQYGMVPIDRYTSKANGWDWDKYAEWDEMPLAKLRADPSLRDKKYAWLTESNDLSEQLELAARCDSCDWEVTLRDHPDFLSVFRPRLELSRNLARILSVRVRLEILDGKYDEAIRTFQTGYALARHAAHGPTVIQCLVGTAISGVMSRQVEDFIQQPDAPNLYWAVATLPRPLIDFRPGWEGEMDGFFYSFPDLRDLDKKNYSPESWERLLQQAIDRALRESPVKTAYGLASQQQEKGRDAPETDRSRIMQNVQDRCPDARRYLIAHGRSAADVEAMSVPQAILLYSQQTYEELRNDMFKYFFMPYPQVRKRMEQVGSQAMSNREVIPLFSTSTLRALLAAKNAQTRIDRNLAALQVLEAIRLYGAAHDGRLPDSLSDITEVPIPLDPFRDEPFLYERTGTNTAILKSPPAPITPLRYEIQFVREGEKR